MKTTFLKSVVLVALVFAGVLNSGVNAKNKFFTNDEMSGDMIISKTVYRYDGQLRSHSKYNYTYDENSRMTSKETLTWNEDNKSWMPYYRMNFSYSESKMTIELSIWNANESAYNIRKQKSEYELDATNQPTNHIDYAWDNKRNNWKEVNSTTYYAEDQLLFSQNK